MTHKRYLVTGRRQYRWHAPGTVFEAKLDPAAEQRAIERGSIRVLAIIEPALENGSYRLPNDQPASRSVEERATRDAVGGSRVK